MKTMTQAENRALPVHFNADGTFGFQAGAFRLENCRNRLRVDGREEVLRWRTVRDDADGVELEAGTESGDWRFAFLPDGDGGLSLSFTGRLHAPRAEVILTVCEIPELAADHLLTQFLAMGRCQSLELPRADRREFTCYYQTMITRNGETLQISFPLRTEHIGFVAGTAGETLTGLSARYEIRHNSRTDVNPPPVAFRASADGFALMERWAAVNADGRQPSPPPTPGWNSWDYYRWTVTEEQVLENARFIAADPVLSRHVKRIIVDDGWQYCYGEWDANPLFPSGMKSLAAELRQMKFEPGLWFAPALAEPQSRIAQLRPGMLAQGESGLPCLGFECMKRHAFLLDPTRPETEAFLGELFRRYCDYGYTYFKLDFLRALLLGRQFHDRSAGQGELMRRLLSPIREATRNRAEILGCNYPFATGTDLADAVRTGSDIHAGWGEISSNSINIAAHYGMNRTLFQCDPDFALCRSPETSDDPELFDLRPILVYSMPDDKEPGDRNRALVGRDIGRNQIEVLLSLILVSAGSINLSDRMTRLNEAGLELARKIVSAEPGEAAVPLDLFEREHVRFWLQRVGGGHRLLLINWEDEPRELAFDLKQRGLPSGNATDFWRGRRIDCGGGRVEAQLPPRSCLLLELR